MTVTEHKNRCTKYLLINENNKIFTSELCIYFHLDIHYHTYIALLHTHVLNGPGKRNGEMHFVATPDDASKNANSHLRYE